MTRSTKVHHEIVSSNLAIIGHELLQEARGSAAAGRAARTVVARQGLRATVIALRAGHQLAQHDSPGSATLVVLEGRAVLREANREWPLSVNDIMAVPPLRHSLLAETDAVVLLTVRLD